MSFPGRLIGGGAFSEVYLLVDHDPPAVIKYVNGGSNKGVELYKKECDILKALSHPNITVLFGTREVPNSTRLGIIMEYCSRGSLKPAILDTKLIYTMKTVLAWAEQLFGALEYMRVHSYVHRDIKPDNIFITSEYFLKIGDFGLTTISEQTRSGSYTGTERYMSPPQIDVSEDGTQSLNFGQQISHRNDIYGLGLVLWELCERKIVLEEYNSHMQFTRESFIVDVMNKKFVKINPIAGPLAKIVAKCTNFNRSLRPQASTILQDLREISQKCPSLSNMDFLPIYDEKQLELVKPTFPDSLEESETGSAAFSDHQDFPDSQRFSDLDERTIYAQTVYAEACGEPREGQIAVAWVIKNRAAQNKQYWGGSRIKNVCLHPYQFGCWNNVDPKRGMIIDDPVAYNQIRELTNGIYDLPMSADPTGGADHFNNPDIDGYPTWTRNCEVVKRIGQHIFYRERREEQPSNKIGNIAFYKIL